MPKKKKKKWSTCIYSIIILWQFKTMKSVISNKTFEKM